MQLWFHYGFYVNVASGQQSAITRTRLENAELSIFCFYSIFKQILICVTWDYIRPLNNEICLYDEIQ